jgi:Ca2+-transporting ATPase
VLGAALLFLSLLLLVPFARELFQFAPMHGVDVVRVLVAGVASVLWFELYKLVRSMITGLGRAGS